MGTSQPLTLPPDRPRSRVLGPTVALLALAVSVAFAPGCAVWYDAVLGRNYDVDAEVSHFTRLWPENKGGDPFIGLSTEDGILLLTRPGFRVGDIFDIHFPIGNSMVRDWGELDRLNENLTVVRPLSARQSEGRFAASAPTANESVFVAVRDANDDPVMEEADWWQDGEYGDWISLDGEAAELAQRYAGTGVYVERDGRFEICGMLSGLVAHTTEDPDDDAGLGFYGLGELSRILPDQLKFYGHDFQPLRPDFEFGVPLQRTDLAGQIKALDPANKKDAPAPADDSGDTGDGAEDDGDAGDGDSDAGDDTDTGDSEGDDAEGRADGEGSGDGR